MNNTEIELEQIKTLCSFIRFSMLANLYIWGINMYAQIG